jgi:hypothetical protein
MEKQIAHSAAYDICFKTSRDKTFYNPYRVSVNIGAVYAMLALGVN